MTLVNGVGSRLRAGSTPDGYGQAAKDWDDTDDVDGLAVWFHQSSSTEVLGNREAQVTTAKVTIWDPTVDIAAGDRFVYAGDIFEVFDVDGDPLISRTPRGPHHIEVNLRRVEG